MDWSRDAEFQPTCPVRGTTVIFPACASASAYFNPRAPYGARPATTSSVIPVSAISTHVPRTGHDAAKAEKQQAAAEFQPTCPVRGTTPGSRRPRADRGYFNPRAPYGARQLHVVHEDGVKSISTHVPRTGHDRRTGRTSTISQNFNPRAPYGARPHPHEGDRRERGISTHVPRTGHDRCAASSHPGRKNFNPRAPYGARLGGVYVQPVGSDISTHVPRTGHDKSIVYIITFDLISTHVPRTGHDFFILFLLSILKNFNPRAPYGARPPSALSACLISSDFNPRAPYGARLHDVAQLAGDLVISTHVPRTGHDDAGAVGLTPPSEFQPTCPVRGTTAILRTPPVQRPAFQPTCPVRGTTRKGVVV